MKIFFNLSRPKGNLSGGFVTILNPKYQRFSSGDTIVNEKISDLVHDFMNFNALKIILKIHKKNYRNAFANKSEASLKMLCGFNKHAVKLRMHKAARYAFPIPLNTF